MLLPNLLAHEADMHLAIAKVTNTQLAHVQVPSSGTVCTFHNDKLTKGWIHSTNALMNGKANYSASG